MRCHPPKSIRLERRRMIVMIIIVSQGDLDVNIDLSVLKLATHRKSLASQLLGPNWQISSCAHAKPPNLVARKMLTLADYKRRQGIA